MIDATPCGEHMDIDTFVDSIEFVKRNRFLMLMISGGEPLEHPQFFEFMEIAKATHLMLVILSNGTFLEDEELRERVLDLGVLVQITNDPRFYPKTVPKIEHPLVEYEHHIRTIAPLGRAAGNGIKASRLAPMCFNLRSAVRSTGDFVLGVMALRSMGKMCTPSINPDGSISAGESGLCHKIGTVRSPLMELTTNLKRMRCNKCGLEDNLGQRHLAAIGECK